MDESDVERGVMTGSMLLDCRISEIRRRAGASGLDARRECRDCGEDIPVERLHAAPGAARCIDCQRLTERGFIN